MTSITKATPTWCQQELPSEVTRLNASQFILFPLIISQVLDSPLPWQPDRMLLNILPQTFTQHIEDPLLSKLSWLNLK